MFLLVIIGESLNSNISLVVGTGALVYTSRMDEQLKKIEQASGRLVHEFLAHSYFIYLAAVVIGFGLDMIWPVNFAYPWTQPVGFFLIILGTILSVWAQAASEKGGHARNGGDLGHHHFKFGPYSYTRTPTQYGLFLMTLGLALLFGSVFMVVTTIIAFLFGKLFFIKKQEEHLEKKYGEPYR